MRNVKTSRRFAGTIVVLVLSTVIAAATALAGSASPRSGDLGVAKECSGFDKDPP
jgi:hypothetical protein